MHPEIKPMNHRTEVNLSHGEMLSELVKRANVIVYGGIREVK